MKKYLAVAGVAAVGATAVAIGPASAQQAQQYPLPNITKFDAKLTPSKVGTKRKPKGSKLSLKLEIPKESRATADTITFNLPRDLRFGARKFTRFCSYTRINTEGVSSCHKSTKVGKGTASAAFGPNLTPITFDTQLFIGSKSGELAIYLQARGLPIQKAIRGVVGRAGSPYYHKMTVIIPPELQRQLGAYVYLTGLEATVQGKQKRGRKTHHLLNTVGCPKNKRERFEARVTFVPNPNPPALGEVKRGDSDSCRR